MMFQALRSLIASEDLLYAITVVWVGMSNPSAPSLKHKRQRPRKKCLDKLIMALDLWLSIRLHGIRHLIKLHGGKHQGIKLLNIKLLGLMHLGTNHLSISDTSRDLYLPIIVAKPRSNPSTWKGRRRWKMINTTVSHLFGCKAWWNGWVSRWSHASNHQLEGRLGSRRRITFTPWGGIDAPSKRMCSCLGFGSYSKGIRFDCLTLTCYILYAI